MRSDQAGSLVRRRRAAVRRRGQGHHKRAALEFADFLLERQVLGAGHIGAGEMRHRLRNGTLVIAKPGLVAHADTGRHHQPVVVHVAARRVHAALVTVDVCHFGLHKGVAMPARGSGVGVLQKLRVHHVHQPFVAQGARPEKRVLFEQHHFQIGGALAQVAGGGQTPPATAKNHDAAFAAFGQQLGSGAKDERLGRQGQRAKRAHGCRTLKQGTAMEGHAKNSRCEETPVGIQEAAKAANTPKAGDPPQGRRVPG